MTVLFILFFLIAGAETRYNSGDTVECTDFHGQLN